MSVVNAVAQLLGGEGYQMSRSLRLRSSASAYLNRTPAGAGNRKTFSIGWAQKRTLAGGSVVFCAGDAGGPTNTFIVDYVSDSLRIIGYVAGSLAHSWTTTQVFRDPSAWYHFLLAVDTTQATANNRMRLYVNGVEVTSFTRTATFAQNADTSWNAALAHYVGRLDYAAVGYPDTYLTEINSVTGLQLTPSSFGAFDPITGVWTPAKYGGAYGTNGFYLNFSDPSAATAAAIGKDSSGNGNNWTPNNVSITAGVTYDSMIDVPTMWADGGNGRGNYCVMNPLDSGASFTPSDGNMRIVLGSSLARTTRGTMGVSSGKWYFETVVGGSGAMVAVATAVAALGNYAGSDSSGWSYYGVDGNKYTGGVNTAYGSTFTTNDVIGVALDMDNGKVWFSKNGTWQASGDPAAGTNAAYTTLAGTVFPALSYANTGGTSYFNAGQRPFAYTPPTGFKALNTQNLPDGTIKAGNKFFDVSLYTGNGTSQNVVNSGGFQPDLVWVKERSGTRDHRLVDSVRGVGKELYSDLTFAEATDAVGLTSFNSNGYSLGSSVGYNANGITQVGWQWKKGAAQGFDIVTYTGNGTSGRTVAHALGVAPAMTIIKRRDAVQFWIAWHKSLAGYANNLYLQTTDSVQADGNFTALPNSTVLTLDAGKSVNVNTATYVAYLFAEVAGFSKFGSYTGNGSADGQFVYLGFRPKFVLIKATSTTGNWEMLDSSRDTYNPEGNLLRAQSSGAEIAAPPVNDFLSNGFKPRSINGSQNDTGVTYVYAAFAENPFKNSLAR